MTKCFGHTSYNTRCSRINNRRQKYCWQHQHTYSIRQFGGNGESPKLIEAKKSELYLPVNRQQAEFLLQVTPIGTYLFRDSTQPGMLAVSHFQRNGTTGHGLVRVWNGEQDRVGFSIEDSRETFNTLEELCKSFGNKINKHLNQVMRNFAPIADYCDQESSMCQRYFLWEEKRKEQQAYVKSHSQSNQGTQYGSLY